MTATMESTNSFTTGSSVGDKSEVAENSTRAMNDVEQVNSAPLSPAVVEVEKTDKNMFGVAFRNYEDGARQSVVAQNYKEDHENMTVDVVKQKMDRWLRFDHGEHTIMEVIELLDGLVDESDPDVDIPNSIHDFQTAERIRKQFPEPKHDWFHLCGLLHDLGKVLSMWGEPQWCVVGDTYPVGCTHEDAIVFHKFFENNPDASHPVYGTKLGMYKEGCGISNLTMAWGHDEYMYHMLKKNTDKLPQEALHCIRYHSFYPWHSHGAYTYFENDEDKLMKKWVQEFNKFDLYSKSDDLPDVEALKPYYQSLLEKYGLGGKLVW